MADPKEALRYVESSEYRKEYARQLAKRLAADMDIRRVIDEGGDYAFSLLDDLVGKIKESLLVDAVADARAHAKALGLEGLSDFEIRQVVAASVENVGTEAMHGLEARLAELDRALTRMEDGGASLATIRASVTAEGAAKGLLSGLSSVLTSTAAGIVADIESNVLRSAAFGTDQKMREDDPDAEPPLWRWETREDDKVCEDLYENSCAPRHGDELTMEEWGAFGEPQSPNLICSIYAKGAFSNCRCVLEPANAAANPEPLNITEAAARGRERAQAAFPEVA
ncbi:MAG TPA: hypothetical protein PLB01_00305 [Thermoanaerobaculia bacterium]|nr:hypothetical protein [Thermoanaerobaculia bacterium]